MAGSATNKQLNAHVILLLRNSIALNMIYDFCDFHANFIFSLSKSVFRCVSGFSALYVLIDGSLRLLKELSTLSSREIKHLSRDRISIAEQDHYKRHKSDWNVSRSQQKTML